MADFRRWVTALALLTLFTGLASAQIGGTGGTQQVCNSVAQVTPTLRSEGITELVGDIVITCTGGNYVTPGQQIPQANLIVSLTAPVTSRLTSSSAATGASEALLMIDEPNSGLTPVVPGFGPAAGFSICTATDGTCLEYATIAPGTSTVVATDVQYTGGNPPGTINPGKNVFVGVVNGNQVSFNGIPILPPVTSGVQRVYRITNVRVNASGAGSSVVSGVQPVYAYLSSSGPTSLPVSQAALTVGFVQTSLSLSVTSDKVSGGALTSAGVNQFTQCNLNMGSLKDTALGAANVALLNYTENFPSAFKTRVGLNPSTGLYTSPTTSGSNYSYLGTSTNGTGYTQNVPGTLYNSESGFILGTSMSKGTFVAGLADSGTRFQAVFANLPSGATIYVSKYNVNSFTTTSLPSTGTPGVAVSGAVQPTIAALTTGGASGAFSGYSTLFPTYAYGSTLGNTIEVVPLTVTGGAATAVWEVLSSNTSANETFSFGVYIAYTPDLTKNTPTPGSAATVTLSYAPIGTGSLPASPNWIPRFIAGAASTAQPLLNIVKCQTVLLFPYITADAGFNTGIAISNTSADPLTAPGPTQTSTGSCSLSFYGTNAPTGTIAPLGPIPAGNGSDTSKFTFMLYDIAPNFTGYMFAVCDFQYAHGFAFISDLGVRNLAMGYLALIVNNGVPLNQRAKGTQALAAENLNQ